MGRRGAEEVGQWGGADQGDGSSGEVLPLPTNLPLGNGHKAAMADGACCPVHRCSIRMDG